MNSESFAYWLQGFFEMTDATSLTDQQVQMIKDHLGLVFKKETPTAYRTYNVEYMGVPNSC